jgi:hypothetical protein
MNPRQKVVIWIGTVLIVAMGLYPPWVRIGTYVGEGIRLETNQCVYGLVFSPPRAVGDISEESSGLVGRFAKARALSWTIQLDIMRLLVQWATVAFGALGTAWILRQRL